MAARVALRRVQISPLGVARRVTPPAPSAYRLIPLVAGIGELAYFAGVGHPRSSTGQIGAYFLGFLLIMAGLIMAGPWLTMACSRIMAGRTSRAALIAGRRLSDNPRAAFRSIGGLILALFVTSVAAGITTTIIADHGAPAGGAVASDTLADQFVTGQTLIGPSVDGRGLDPRHSAERAALHQGRPGRDGDPHRPPRRPSPKANQSDLPGLASCAQLSSTPALGRCAAGRWALPSITLNLSGAETSRSQAATVWPVAAISLQRLHRIPVQTIIVGTNGSSAAIERARTALEAAFPYLGPPAIISGSGSQSTYTELQHMTDVVILASLVIAGCSLAVSVAAGLTDRKRPFSLLRLTGAPIGVLRRVVALESAAPLIIVALVSAGTGFLASGLFLRSELGESLRPPGAGYYLIVFAGLAASLGVIASTLPLLQRITGPENARNE